MGLTLGSIALGILHTPPWTGIILAILAVLCLARAVYLHFHPIPTPTRPLTWGDLEKMHVPVDPEEDDPSDAPQ